MNFIGRKNEIALLTEENWRDQAELTVVYGRRRVGKTALIEKAYSNKNIWKFEGLEGGSRKEQLKLFGRQLSKYTNQTTPYIFKDWPEAFETLADKIPQNEVIIFFDEFQWLSELKPKLVSLFKYYWDQYFQQKKQCRFILCGSVSSFIVKKILKSKALYGRINKEIKLKPLSFKESSCFFKNHTTEEKLKIYMTIGGVPKYLLEYRPHLSYLQNIDQSFFSNHGYFYQEFEKIFISHFSHHSHYRKILELLAINKSTSSELAKKCGIKKGGSFSDILEDLTLAGFIEKYTPLDKTPNSRILKYRLFDEYLHFYFCFIFPNINKIQQGQLAFDIMNPQKIDHWLGYAFERMCLKHSKEIADYLKFSGIEYKAGSWFRNDENIKAQIDLIFERKDKVLTVCEIKFTERLHASKIIEATQSKTTVLKKLYPNYAIQNILITGKTENIPQKLKTSFSKIIVARDIFGD